MRQFCLRTTGRSFDPRPKWRPAPWTRSGGGLALRRVCAELVCARLDPGSSSPVGAPEPWPLVGIIAVLIDVPARAAGVPDRRAEGGAQLRVERVGCLTSDLDPRRARSLEMAESRDHMADAGLDRVDDRARPAIRVGAVQQEH